MKKYITEAQFIILKKFLSEISPCFDLCMTVIWIQHLIGKFNRLASYILVDSGTLVVQTGRRTENQANVHNSCVGLHENGIVLR